MPLAFFFALAVRGAHHAARQAPDEQRKVFLNNMSSDLSIGGSWEFHSPTRRPENGPHRPATESFEPLCTKSLKPLLLLVEGANDAEFLIQLSRLLYRAQIISIDLAQLVRSAQVVIVPMGGGISAGWWNLFAPLECPEFHLLDGEIQPQTSQRLALAQRVNARPLCCARVTAKRSLENYLHAEAIAAAGGGQVAVSDEVCLAQALARSKLAALPGAPLWEDLSARTRQRLTYRAKKFLNTQAAGFMTPARLAERDPPGEVRSWFIGMAKLLAAQHHAS